MILFHCLHTHDTLDSSSGLKKQKILIKTLSFKSLKPVIVTFQHERNNKLIKHHYLHILTFINMANILPSEQIVVLISQKNKVSELQVTNA